jgi:cell wall assembly regulator SMI1
VTDVAQSWRRIERWFELIGIKAQLNPPASDDAVSNLEWDAESRRVRLPLP